MSEQDITPKILKENNNVEEFLNVQQNNLNNDKNRLLLINDDNTSSNTHKISEKNNEIDKSNVESLEKDLLCKNGKNEKKKEKDCSSRTVVKKEKSSAAEDEHNSQISNSSYKNKNKKKSGKRERSCSRPSKSRSRSRDRKHKHKHEKHEKKSKRNKKKSSRSRSRSRNRYKSRSRSTSRHDRDNKYHSRNKRSRSRSAEKKEKKRTNSDAESESENSKNGKDNKNYYAERRKVRERSRSNSALRVMKMKNLENTCGYFQRYYQRPHQDNDPKKPPLYWDGYQWVIRPSSFTEQNFDVIKPGRKIIVANLPLQLNLLVNHLKEFLIKSALEKNIVSKKEMKENNDLIRTIELDSQNNTAIIAMENIEFAKRMVLLDGIVLLGHTLRISAYQDINSTDINCSNISKAGALANSAHLSAKSAAIAWAAFQNYSKNDNIQLNLNDNKINIASRYIKVYNACDYKEALKFDSERFEEVLLDMKEEFSKYGNIVSCNIIKPKHEKLGAECGSVFIEFQDSISAELVMKQIKHKRYEGREIKVSYIDEEVYKKDILS